MTEFKEKSELLLPKPTILKTCSLLNYTSKRNMFFYRLYHFTGKLETSELGLRKFPKQLKKQT
jgi:hypothetical protein